MSTQTIDWGKRMRARFPGECAECGGTIETGDEIYFSRTRGYRHRRCVDGEPDPDEASAAPRAPATSPRAEPAAPNRDAAARTLFDDAARAARDGTAARDGDSAAAARDDVYTAPPRDTEFGRAGDREYVRQEMAAVLELVIGALERLVKLLR